MEPADALRLVERAKFELNVIEGSLEIAQGHLEDCVKLAHQLEVSTVDLARAAGCHRNTIRAWCAKKSDKSAPPSNEEIAS